MILVSALVIQIAATPITYSAGDEYKKYSNNITREILVHEWETRPIKEKNKNTPSKESSNIYVKTIKTFLDGLSLFSQIGCAIVDFTVSIFGFFGEVVKFTKYIKETFTEA